MIKNVLITNMALFGYTGSELHVVDLARAFRARGIEVTCFTLATAHPILGMLEAEGVRVVEYPNADGITGSYDLLIAQHHVVSDYVAALPNVTFNKAVISSLGALTADEATPAFATNNDIFVFNSQECLDNRRDELPQDAQNILLFPNCYQNDFRDLPPRTFADKPQRIAVVSNRYPQEVADLADKIDANTTIDFIGKESAVLANAQLLSAYDLIITIGRTVLNAFAGRIPLFCYDYLGGPGYITLDTIQTHADFNFSGRSAPKKMETDELWEAIQNGYTEAVAQLDRLRDWSLVNRSFDTHLDNLLDLIEKTESHTPPSSSTSTSPLKRHDLFSQHIRAILLGRIGTARIAYNASEGEGDHDERSMQFSYTYGTQMSIDLKALGIPSNHVIRSFSPSEHPCICTLSSPAMDAIDAVTHGDTATFPRANPTYRATAPLTTEEHLTFHARSLSATELTQITINDLQSQLVERTRELDTTLFRENSLKWSLTHLLRLIKDRMRSVFNSKNSA